MTRQERIAALKAAAKERILILDGSWGVMIQRRGLDEADYRGDRFTEAKYPGQMKGNNDILCITRPDIVTDLHNAYFAAGADISETNTFSATIIAQDDYKLDAESVRDINLKGARLGREAADAWTAKEPQKPRFLAGSIGPLNKMLSMSSDVNDPGARSVTFDEVYEAYRQQIQALNEGGVDLYLIETITDTLNCKAAIKAIMDLEAEGMEKLPIWISGTITDRSGRTLSGQTVEAFWNSVRHARPFAIGFNCALGADLMRPHIAALSRVADTLVAAYPNAGLPNEMGQYDEQPEQTSGAVGGWAQDGLVNILGGCCGTTPEHIAAIAKAVEGVKPRDPAPEKHTMRLAGLEPFEVAS
ncbi:MULTISPECIES: homocysteine S-methyltransferase family protein [unclassified Hyphomonas]|jgi:5-methyltetrahydrofolate--homocysteine methyltransferase|uniref:homocysteine S-methyltransferase family protein n=1 Tax=unclassified Hyphomonas TaxID=2630699 RepID=UPI000458A017|nr:MULTISPECIES: homocysteine S-methyltransferase family protein [unclassified Hyphomonas]KCZ49212.1 5-methyltetrahydrofolate--homocysteine methyltransferase [Hyphomonas sp. CY54-11-8]RAN41885.1 5-methyltetrahydrofolate--homocysteine methyltransferase [Hyphomonas sp. GM-8P]